jgi:hypothetical protein
VVRKVLLRRSNIIMRFRQALIRSHHLIGLLHTLSVGVSRLLLQLHIPLMRLEDPLVGLLHPQLRLLVFDRVFEPAGRQIPPRCLRIQNRGLFIDHAAPQLHVQVFELLAGILAGVGDVFLRGHLIHHRIAQRFLR